MKRLLILPLIFLSVELLAQDFIGAEYFFDSDPGPGNGTSISLGSTADPLVFSTSIPVTSLAPGFHTLAIRLQEAGGVWSPFEGRGFYISKTTTDTPGIISAEYFFDSDPGAGNGTVISVTPGDVTTFTIPVPSAALLPGFHFLAIRVMDASGMWGIYESRGFYISKTTADTPGIISAEYFFDSDPGAGNGTVIPLTSGDVTTFTIPVPAVTLLPGFHFLTIRVIDANGMWGIYESRGFYISSATADVPDLVAAEYFFDNDPGAGNGTSIAITNGATASLTVPIDATSLTSGFHFLAIRTRGQDGKWGLYESRGFYVSTTTVSAADIVSAEYFFDNDPGAGNATGIAVAVGATSNFTVPVSAVALTPGFHFLAIRAKGMDGKWGMFESRGFYVSPDIADVGNIIAAEYFVDTDPGEGSAIALPVSPGDTITENFTITVSDTLDPGTQQLAIRVQTSDGNWSFIDTREFTIISNFPPVADAGPDQTITLPSDSTMLNASGSTDDGTITAFSWVMISGQSTSVIENPDQETTQVGDLSQGVYEFELTVMDDENSSDKDTVVITVNPAPNQSPVADAGEDVTITLPVNSVDLDGTASSDPDGTIASFSWVKLAGPETGTIANPAQGSTAVTDLSEGVYEFKLTVTDNENAFDKDTILVAVNPVPNQPPVANAGADQQITLPVDSVRLNGASSSDPDGAIGAFFWSKVNGPSSGTIVTPDSAVTDVVSLTEGVYVFALQVTDNDVAMQTDTIRITVGADPCPPVPVISQNGSVLTCDTPGQQYQWFLNNDVIAGATSQSVEITVFEYGVYAVEITSDGCTVRSEYFPYLVTEAGNNFHSIHVFPNPFTNRFVVDVPDKYAGSSIALVSPSGGTVLKRKLMTGVHEIATESLSAGIYYLVIDSIVFIKIAKN